MRKSSLMDEDGFEAELEDILGELANIYKEAYHGGMMNGVCCIRLLEYNSEVMKAIKEMCEKCLNSRNESEVQNCTHEEMEKTLESFSNIFEALDCVFSSLRIVDPTDGELQQTEKAVRILETMWRKMGLNITPKAHIAFNHICEQQRMFSGLADKCEDWVEQTHQTGLKLDYLTARIPRKYENKQQTQLATAWRNTDPKVQKHQQYVLEQTRKQKKNDVIHSPAANSKLDKKKERMAK